MRALALALGLGLARVAAANPSNATLVYVGLGLAPVDYLAGVALHEGSHALAAKLVGASVDELHLFPPGVDPQAHVFRFGWTYVHGLRTRGDQIWFYIAPKIADATLLGGFAALAFTGAWPRNRYGQLALTVAGTGLWVDFAKDVVLVSPENDMSKVYKLWCLTGWRQIPTRLVYAAADVALALVVAHAYERTFTTPSTASSSQGLVLPVLSASF